MLRAQPPKKDEWLTTIHSRAEACTGLELEKEKKERHYGANLQEKVETLDIKMEVVRQEQVVEQ